MDLGTHVQREEYKGDNATKRRGRPIKDKQLDTKKKDKDEKRKPGRPKKDKPECGLLKLYAASCVGLLQPPHEAS